MPDAHLQACMHPDPHRVRVHRVSPNARRFMWLIEESHTEIVMHRSEESFATLEGAYEAGRVAFARMKSGGPAVTPTGATTAGAKAPLPVRPASGFQRLGPVVRR